MHKESLLDTFPFWKTNLNITNWQPATVAQTAVSWKQMLLASKKNNNRIPTRFGNVSSARRRSLIPIRSVSFRSINKIQATKCDCLIFYHCLVFIYYDLFEIWLLFRYFYLLLVEHLNRSIDGFIFVLFALKSLAAVVALDLNFDCAEQKIQDAKIHSLDKETRGKT